MPLAYEASDQRRYGVLPIPGSPYTAEITVHRRRLRRPDQARPAPGRDLHRRARATSPAAEVIDQGTPSDRRRPDGHLRARGGSSPASTSPATRACRSSGSARSSCSSASWSGSSCPHKRLWARITSRPNGGTVVGLATLDPQGRHRRHRLRATRHRHPARRWPSRPRPEGVPTMAKLSEYAFMASMLMTAWRSGCTSCTRCPACARRAMQTAGASMSAGTRGARLRPAHRGDRHVRHDPHLAGHARAAAEPRAPHDRHRPRPVRRTCTSSRWRSPSASS